MTKTVFIIVILLFSVVSFSQTSNQNLIIHQSNEIDQLVKKHKIVNEKKPEFDGWRVQIFSSSGANSSDRANLAKAEFLSKYPDANVYIVFSTPDFKVRIGDFRTKMEALFYIQQIKKEYPFAFAVIDKINPPEITLP